MIELEIAVQDVAGVRTAFDAGADRVELCQALTLGGLTPSSAMIEAAVAAAPTRAVRVLVRARPGGFVLQEGEFELLCADARRAIDAGAGAVVVGALTAAGEVDGPAVERLLEAAGGALVFHRAIDASVDALAAAEALVAAGVPEALTSGGAARSIDGATTIAAIARRLPQLGVVAGGGVRTEDIPALVTAGVRAVHLSARVTVPDAPAGPGGGPSSVDRTDATLVRRAAAATTEARG